jgi:hypothetical protein
MRFIRAWRSNAAQKLGPRSAQDAPRELLGALIGLAQENRIFAAYEICKGLVVVAIGDMVIADELGGFVEGVAQDLRNGAGRLPCAVLEARRTLLAGLRLEDGGAGRRAARARGLIVKNAPWRRRAPR